MQPYSDIALGHQQYMMSYDTGQRGESRGRPSSVGEYGVMMPPGQHGAMPPSPHLQYHQHLQQQQHHQQQQQQQAKPLYYTSESASVSSERPQYHNGGHIGPATGPGAHRKPAGRAQEGQQTDADFALDTARLSAGVDKRTTLMIRNIPNKYTQISVLDEINARHLGDDSISSSRNDINNLIIYYCSLTYKYMIQYPFNRFPCLLPTTGKYDFFYLPIDFKNRCNVGYAFINFNDPSHISSFHEEFNGHKWKNFNSEKVCQLTFARIQGKQAMISRFQNSSLLEKDDGKYRRVS